MKRNENAYNFNTSREGNIKMFSALRSSHASAATESENDSTRIEYNVLSRILCGLVLIARIFDNG